jgi:hypothetical protein
MRQIQIPFVGPNQRTRVFVSHTYFLLLAAFFSESRSSSTTTREQQKLLCVLVCSKLLCFFLYFRKNHSQVHSHFGFIWKRKKRTKERDVCRASFGFAALTYIQKITQLKIPVRNLILAREQTKLQEMRSGDELRRRKA